MAGKGVELIYKLVDLVSGPLNKIGGILTGTTSKVGKFTNSFDRIAGSAFNLNQLNQSLQGLEQVLTSISAPSVAFEQSMAELSAITGITGNKLAEIGILARENAKVFGGDASESVASYTRLLSALGPEIAQNPAALAKMGKSVSILATTMKGDAVGAAEALTGAMNQYGVDLTNPEAATKSMAKMMDIMAAGARAGNAEVPDIAAAIKVSGLSAKNAGINFQEYVASLEVLAKGSVKGAEAGTGLRNVLAIMGRQEFM